MAGVDGVLPLLEMLAHNSQVILKTRDKCVKAVDAAMREGKSCVVGESITNVLSDLLRTEPDNTNRDSQTRKHYLEISRKMNVPAR